MSQSDYYHMGQIALKFIDSAKDNISLEQTWWQADSIAKAYINVYPDKPQGYTIRVYAAKKADRDTSRGLAVGPITFANQFYWRDTATYRKTIFANDYYLFIYYYHYCSLGERVERDKKAMEFLDEMLLISIPGSLEHNLVKDLLNNLNFHHPFTRSVKN